MFDSEQNIRHDEQNRVMCLPAHSFTLFGPHLVPFGTMPMFLVLSSSTAILHSMPYMVYSARLPVMDSLPPKQNIDPHLRFLQKKKEKQINQDTLFWVRRLQG